MHVCMYACMYVCMCVCTFGCSYVHMFYVPMFLCLYVCVNVCKFSIVSVCVDTYHIQIHTSTVYRSIQYRACQCGVEQMKGVGDFFRPRPWWKDFFRPRPCKQYTYIYISHSSKWWTPWLVTLRWSRFHGFFPASRKADFNMGDNLGWRRPSISWLILMISWRCFQQKT